MFVDSGLPGRGLGSNNRRQVGRTDRWIARIAAVKQDHALHKNRQMPTKVAQNKGAL